jgi:hypothetical protein
MLTPPAAAPDSNPAQGTKEKLCTGNARQTGHFAHAQASRVSDNLTHSLTRWMNRECARMRQICGCGTYHQRSPAPARQHRGAPKGPRRGDRLPLVISERAHHHTKL